MRRVTKTATSADAAHPTASGWQTIKRVLPYLWPTGQGWIKRRVVGALLMLVASKIVSVTTPFLYKQAVDVLAKDATNPATFLMLGAVGLTVAYGMARLGSVGRSALVFCALAAHCQVLRRLESATTEQLPQWQSGRANEGGGKWVAKTSGLRCHLEITF